MARGAAKLGRSVLELDVEDSKFTTGLNRNGQKARSWTDNLGRDIKRGIGQGIGIGGGMMVANAVAGAVDGVKQVVAGSISAAIEWESAMAGVRKTVDASEEEYKALGDAIIGMSEEMPIASTELAGLAEAAGALGIAKNDITEFTRVTAMIGTTTDVAAGDAATSLGQLSNVLGLTSEDYERFGSTLVDLGNKGASTESQILQIASRAGAGAKLLDIASDATLGWSSAVANLGIEVEAGGSALQTFFLKSAKAVAGGGEKLQTYARIAGTTAADFTRAFGQDASGALQKFLAGLGELSQGDRLKALTDLDFNDVRITRMLLGLAGNAEMLGGSLDIASEAWEENTAMAEEAEKRYGTTESKLIVLNNRVSNLAATFGEELTPSLVTFATVAVDELEVVAGDVGTLLEDIGRTSQRVANQFGDQGDAIRDLVDRGVGDFDELNIAIADYMAETGASFDGALESVELYGAGNATALKGMEADWEAMQGVVSGSLRGLPGETAAATEGVEGALIAGQEGIGLAANGVEEAITTEMREARDASLKAMKEMLTGIAGMFESDESVREAMQGIIDRMDDPYTVAERKAEAFSQNTVGFISGALKSGDPTIAADAALLVNNMLAEIALMEPGALESGDAVPPAIQAGMDAQMAALITWIETNVTGESLAAMSLDEANAVGVGGIWSYAQGMRQNKLEAVWAAGEVAYAAVVALKSHDQSAANGGYSIVSSWIAGMTGAWGEQQWKVDGIVGHAADIFGRSLPRRGPLMHPDRGGRSIGEAWVGAMVGVIGDSLHDVESVVGSVGSALAPNLGPMVSGAGMPAVAGLDARMSAAGSAGSGLGGITNVYQLNVNGVQREYRTRDDFMDALDDLARLDSTPGSFR